MDKLPGSRCRKWRHLFWGYDSSGQPHARSRSAHEEKLSGGTMNYSLLKQQPRFSTPCYNQMLRSLSADQVVDSHCCYWPNYFFFFFFKFYFCLFPLWDQSLTLTLAMTCLWKTQLGDVTKYQAVNTLLRFCKIMPTIFVQTYAACLIPPDSDWRTRKRLTGLFWLEKLFWVRSNDSDRWQGSRLCRCETGHSRWSRLKVQNQQGV